MAKTNLAITTTEIHGAVVVLIVGGTRGYGGGGNGYCDCYGKVYTSNSKNNIIYGADIIFIMFSYVGGDYAI